MTNDRDHDLGASLDEADEPWELPGEPSGPPGSSGDLVDPSELVELEELDELTAAKSEAQRYLDHLQRLQAEFDNYRKRVLREQTAAIELAAEPVIRRLLEVLDDFELALIAAERAEQQIDVDQLRKGVELVFAKLADTLKAEGLQRIVAEGEPFDPERHEALMQTGGGDGEPVVAEVFRTGYTLKGRVIRPAGVRVERK